MSAGPEQATDLVAVACVVEASLLLATEWSRILIDYVLPLLKRLGELHPAHQFRLAFVTYGAADTRPRPLLSKRFFAPLSVVTKELREEPSKLGIGQTNSGGGRGLAALEGLVAAIELFDILMASTNSAANQQSPQKEHRSLISHLLHIAASPPDNVPRPQWNYLQHLDTVNWDTIPTELRKRKINLSLISLRKIPQFQDLHSSVAGSSAQSPWFNVHTPHVLLLAGFPTPQKSCAKRQTDTPFSDQSPDPKRQKVATDAISKTSSASPALPSARISANQRSQQPVPSQVPQPPSMTVSSQTSSPALPVQTVASAPPSTSASATPVPPPTSASGPSLPPLTPEIPARVVNPQGVKFGQMMEHLKALEKGIAASEAQISNAQNTAQTAVLASLQKDRASIAHRRDHIRTLLRQHYQKAVLGKEAVVTQPGITGTTLPDGQTDPSLPVQPHPSNVPSASSERPSGPTVEENKASIHDTQILTTFWQSRGGTVSTVNDSTPPSGSSQLQPHPTPTPEAVTQVQKVTTEMKGIRSQTSGSSLQTAGTAQETSVLPNTTNNQPKADTSTWFGSFLWTFPSYNSQAEINVQIQLAGIIASNGNNVRTDSWPKQFTLNLCKQPVKDLTELSHWLRRHQPRSYLMQFRPNPPTSDGGVNEQKFQAVYKYMADRHIYAYTGWPLPSGKFSYNIFVFPMRGSFAGAVFPDGIPDLPGNGNAFGGQPSVEEARPQPQLQLPAGIPPAILARMEGLDPAKKMQLISQFVMRAQQEQLRRQQQSQQSQQPINAPSQTLNSLGMNMPTNPYGGNIPASLLANANANAAANAGAYNTGGGTVNYEMLQSFMQRNAEGSSSQGMSSGQ